MISPKEIIRVFDQTLDIDDPILQKKITQACLDNPWFTKKNYELSIQNVKHHLLDPDRIDSFSQKYPAVKEPKIVGLVLAGNIPLVGMHDIITVILAGHQLKLKLSEKDQAIYRYLFDQVYKIFPESKQDYQVVSKLSDFDAIIATGSNNSSRYFEYYFGKYPHIIRKNRNSVAVLDGNENNEQIKALGEDIHTYFGLGCRNVSKIYVPENYNFEFFLEQQKEYCRVIDHPKYKHNYDYNLSTLIINDSHYMNNGHLLLVESPQVASRISMLHYEYYDQRDHLADKLDRDKDLIQCIVSDNFDWNEKSITAFGQTQKPGLEDFADGINTMEFLLDEL